MTKIPYSTTPKLATSGSVANAVAAASLVATVDQFNWLTGFDISGGGATAAILAVVTVTGLQGGTITFVVGVPAGALVGVNFEKKFSVPLRSSAKNTAIGVSVVAFGLGNTAVVVNAYGYASSE